MRAVSRLLPPIAAVLFLIPSAGTVSRDKTSEALHRLFASEWDYDMQQSPTWASALGDRRWNDRWEDLSLQAIQKKHEHHRGVLKRLEKIDRTRLSQQDKLNFDLFKHLYETRVEEHQYRWYLIPLTQLGGVQSISDTAESLRFQTVKDYEDWIARLRALPGLVDQTVALMREGMRERMLLPQVVLQRVPAQIDKQIVADPEKSPFFEPFKKFPNSIPQGESRRLAEAAKEAITARVVPAYKKLKPFFASEYLPASFDSVGVWQMADGERLYAFFTRVHTTTKLTPREIHELGLREVKRIRAEMEAIRKSVGFQGTLNEFFASLRTDPQFFFKTADELLTAYQATAKRVDPTLVKLFKTLPRIPYGVEPMPATTTPDAPTAYYNGPAADGSRAGTFWVNLHNAEERPKYEMMALTLHEAVPGHHFQIAIAMEQGALPNFRRYGGYTAYGEGWALYAESLGDELELYADPYSKFGRLTYEMWRAVRLVVDTGMHLMRWDRQKAIDYFMENAAKQRHEVINEIDRYIVWPGQALGYKIGELKIKELRARASRALGEKFDLREFHDVILKNGSVPLDVLERTVDAWIGERKRR